MPPALKPSLSLALTLIISAFLLIEGVWAARRMFGADAPLAGAKAAVRRLIA